MTPILLKTKHLRAFLSFFLLVFSLSTYATDYYVDASGGSDANSGTSPASAWKTVAKVNASKFGAGDRILFKKGEIWRETLNVPSSGGVGNPITFSSYGSGSNPLITASDLISKGWSADGGNRWKTNITTQPNIVYINGARGTKVTATSAVNTANTWFWAGGILYVYSPANSDPSQYYSAPGIEAGARQIAIDCNDKTDITIDGFTLRDGNALTFNAGIIRVGTSVSSNVTIKNCVIERGRSVGIEALGNSKADNLLIDGCTIQNNGSFGVLYNSDHNNARLLNSSILSNGWASKEDNQQTSNIQGNLCGVEIGFCNIYNGAPGVAYANDQCHGIYISSAGSGFAYIHDNTIYGNSNGAAIKARQNSYIINNLIYNNRLEGVELGGNGSANAVYYVIKNRIYGSTAGFPAISEFAKGTGKISMNVYNNTTYKSATLQSELFVQDNVDTLRICNNIFYIANGRMGVVVPSLTGVKLIDYNLYWRDDGGGAPSNRYSSSTTSNLSGWQAMGFDTHGVNANPNLISPTSDFSLKSGSPAIDKGTPVGLSFGGSAPDLGAIESGGLGNVPPTANAGADTSITLPANLVKLNGSGKDVDGSIKSYSWTKLSGPAAGTIISPNAANTDVSGLTAGTYSFRLTVTDNLGATGSDDIQVTVNAAAPPPNQKPTANAGSDISITLPTNTAKLNGSGTDPDGTIASYSWTMVSGPAGGTILSSTTASTDVNGLAVGIYVFRLTVTDDKGATATDDIQVTVVNLPPPPVNQVPTTNAGSDVSITLPTSSTSFTASATDPDGTISTYAWTEVSGPNTATIQAPAASNTNISGLIAGVYVFQMTVKDNGGATATDNVQVTVNAAPVNLAPTTNAGSDITITLPTSSTSFTATASDPDGTISTYAWTQVSGPNTAAIQTPATSSTNISGLIAGVYVFRMTVKDNGGATAADDVQVTVKTATAPPANQAPTTNAGSDVTITLPTSSTSFTATASDPDGTISTYAWTQVSGPNTAAIQTPAASSTNISGLIAGVYVFRMTVKDNGGATAADDVQVTVKSAPVNQAPTTNAGSDITITLPTSSTSFTATASDPDGTISTYAWTQVSGPNTAAIQTPATTATNVSGLIAGVYVFRMTVKDNGGATAADDVQVTVKSAPVNQAPTTNAGSDITITLPTSSTSFTATASDPDGTISTYAWTQVSGPGTATIQKPAASATNVSGLIAGIYVFRMTVTDNGGATATDGIQVTVKAATPPPPVNQVPTTNAGSDVTITLPTSTTSFAASASDADGTISTYAWTQVSGPNTAAIQKPAASATNISGLIAGVYVFRMTVKDNAGAIATDDIQVTVKTATAPPPPANLAPTANAGSDITISLPTSTTSFAATASDADGTISTYTWSQVSGPNAAAIQTPAGSATNISGLTTGVYVFRITVKDNGGATAADDIQVTVKAAPVNQAPTVNAGTDISMTLPTNSTSFSSAGFDADGTIAQYAWKQIAGPNTANIATPGSSATNISGLVAGLYTFRVTVTDNAGATATDDIRVTVTAAAPPPNTLPVANAGTDVTITLPTSTVIVTGTGTDTDGTIAQYKWTKVSGPSGGTIQTSTTATTTISGLNAGVYVYRLTVTDNNGGTATDNVQITVINVPAPPANQVPTANAGANMSITLPAGLTLNGSGSDVDGSIVSYSWTKVSGPAAVIQSVNSSATNINGIVAGTYIFRLTVTDNQGASATDDIQIIVLSAPAPGANQLPTANAGANLVITLPMNSVFVSGNATDPDGTIVSYAWTKVSGPSGGDIQYPNASATGIANFTAGTYFYRLTVTDDKGATATDDIQIQVNNTPASTPVPNLVPIADAGSDQSIVLPNNSVVLNGSLSSDPDGSIAGYFWTRVQGPGSVTFDDGNTVSPVISGLQKGVYVFELTVTDNSGATATDRVTITVTKVNQKPKAAVVADTVSVNLPVQNSLLDASTSTDPDGNIASYNWAYVDGPTSPKMMNPDSSKTVVTGLVVGTYEFLVTVTDDEGAVDQHSVVVVVNPGATKLVVPVITMYPNPAQSYTNITMDISNGGRAQIILYDVHGRPVKVENFVKPQGSYTYNLNLTTVARGTYVVSIKLENSANVVRKLIRF